MAGKHRPRSDRVSAAQLIERQRAEREQANRRAELIETGARADWKLAQA